ncbi:hypothetical protein [Daejeonella oryzae]|nr:hypothetical protein [Daejeonella oryzae]
MKHSKSIWLHSGSDSSENEYATEIFPKGTFSYSPERDLAELR